MAASRPTDTGDSTKRWDVLGLGAAVVDEFLYVPGYPEADTKIRVQDRDRQPGGLTATALAAAARMGARCAFAGVLGRDTGSQFIAESMEKEGIDLSLAPRLARARASYSTIVVDTTSQTRTIFTDPQVPETDDHVPAVETLRGAATVFLDHTHRVPTLRLARLARRLGIPTVADLERDVDQSFESLLGLCDHLIIPHAFATKITGERRPRLQIERLWAADRRAVVITRGEQGCWYRSTGAGGSVEHQPAFPVTVVDTTGCGDVFHGVYAAALARGLEIREIIRMASAAAALNAGMRGGQTGIPYRSDVETFLAAHPPTQEKLAGEQSGREQQSEPE